MDKRIITYEEYGNLLSELVVKIKKSPLINQINCVFGINRGGHPIAVHLAHHLNIPYEYLDPEYRLGVSLIVDDIADTGKTLKNYHQDAAATATLFYKKRSVVIPTFYVEETDMWICFPWERIDEIPNRPE